MAAVLENSLNPSILNSIPPLRAFTQDFLDLAGSAIRCGVYQRGQHVYRESDQSSQVYAIHHGRVRTLRTTSQGKDVTLFLVEPGQLFGVDSIAKPGPKGQPWGHDAEVIDNDTVVVSLPSREFGLIAAQRPELMGHVMTSLWTQSQDLMDQAETRACLDVRGRLAHTLLMLLHKEGVASEKGMVISPLLTHEELAGLAGTRRESVTTALGVWRREGILTIDEAARSLIVLDVHKLAEYREGGTSAQLIVESISHRLHEVQIVKRESRLAEIEKVREQERSTYRTYTRH